MNVYGLSKEQLLDKVTQIIIAHLSYWWFVLINLVNSVVFLNEILLPWSIIGSFTKLWTKHSFLSCFWLLGNHCDLLQIFFYFFIFFFSNKQNILVQSPGVWNVLEKRGYKSLDKMNYKKPNLCKYITVYTYIYLFLGWFFSFLLYLLY